VGTTTLKTTWRDAAETVANTNPIVLDSAGRAIIYGDGSYRQVVRDRNGNLIWDQITSAFGTGGATTFGDGMAVGTIVTWSGLVAPTHYVFTYGQELSRTTYSSLLSAITLTATASCASGSPILTGFSDTTQIPTGAAIEASCLPGGTTVISTTASTITVSNNANITVSPSVKIFPWGNGNGTSTFNVPDLRGRVLPGRDNMGGTNAARLTTALFGATPDAIGATGGAQSKVLLGANLPAYTPTGTIAMAAHTHFVASTNGGAASALSNSTQMDISATQAGAPIAYSLTGSATAATIGLTSSTTTTGTFTGVAQGGTATAFATIQPSITVNYIIKVLPDTNLSSTGFVTSIGGMTGDILCGTGLTCADNTITVSGGGGGSGTVTSVALSMPGIFSVSGSPVTTAGTLAVAANGTSGGIPYFSSSSTLASSSALTANLPVIGGGAGTAPSVGGRSGNTTTFVTSTGSLTSGNCAKWDASGNLIDSGGTCGGGGGGGSPGGSSTQVQYNNAGSFGGIAGATTDGTALTVASGDLKLGGASSGTTVVMASSAASGTITIPAATDTLVGKATTDTLTNKTYDTAGTGNSFLINGLAATANTGTGAVARATSPTLVTPVLGVATATSINGLSISATAGTLTIPNNASAALITSGNFNLTLTATNTTNSTLPAGSHTLAALDVAQTWTSAQSFNDGTLKVNGAISGALTIDCAGTCGTNTLTLPAGTTDFSATGGASQVVKQTSSGGAFSVARLACSDLSDAGSFCSTSGAFTGALVLTSSANPCFAVGPSGNTNPMFRVICNTASAATGLQITGAAAAGGVALATISSGTNEGLSINAKGSGSINVGSTSTGDIILGNTSGGQVRANGAAGSIALRFVNDNLTGLGSRAALEFSAYANSTEVMRWAQTNITALSTLTTASTFNSNATRTLVSANLQAGTATWSDFEVLGSVSGTGAPLTTISGTTNISSFSISKSQFDTPVITASGSAITITQAQTVYIGGAPTTSSAGGFTPVITSPWSLFVQSGAAHFGANVDFVGAIGVGVTSSTSGTKWLGIAAGATGYSQINFAASTAPTSPNDGDLWFETGACLKLRVSGANTSLCGGGSSTGAPYVGGSLGAVIALSATTYIGPGDGTTSNSATATEADHQVAVTRTGTAKNLTIVTRAAQSGTGSLVATVRKNGVDTAVTLTISAGAAAGTFSDTTHTVSFTQLDLLSVKLVNNATAVGPGLNFSVEYD
jgi:microcystin-dependent protein